MTQFAQEYTDLRTILVANYGQPTRIAWPGEDFAPDLSWDEWLDVDVNHGGAPPPGVGGPHAFLTFGGDTMRTITLDIAINRKLGSGADTAARTTADAIVAYPWTDTATMIYRAGESYLGRSGVWQEAWWRQDLLLTVWREDS